MKKQKKPEVKSNKKDVSIFIKPQTEGQSIYRSTIISSTITFCTGPAGSGKTFLAINMALQGIFSSKSPFDKIVLIRPAKEACTERLGALPGTLDMKMLPWASPIIDNMRVSLSDSQIKNLFISNTIEVVPLAYCRGRSFNNCCIVVDEAQNCNRNEMLMVLTRIGTSSKMIVNGDTSQSDVQEEGLSWAMERLKGTPGIGICRLEVEDIIRNPLIANILDRLS